MDVSVALATYNGGEYLRQQLDSILTQSRQPDEVVISDDGSTDSTPDIVREYEDRYPDIIDPTLTAENQGVNRNFIRAIQGTSGDFVALADQDDIWHEEKLERQLQAVDTETTLVTHNSKLVSRSGDPLDQTLWDGLLVSPKRVTEPGGPNTLERLLVQNFAQGASILIDRDLVQTVSPVPEGFMYDHFITLLAAVSGRVKIIDTCLLDYRQHDEQVRGASSSLFVKITRQLDSSRQEFFERVTRWDSFLNRVGEIDDSSLAYERDFIVDAVERRKQYDSARNRLVSAEHSVGEKVRSLSSLLRGGYSTYAHPGLVVIDLMNGVRFQLRDLKR